MIAAMRSKQIGLSETKRLMQMHREYMEAVNPLVKLKTEVMNCCLVKMTLFPDGHIEKEYTEEGKRIMDVIQDEWERARQAIFEAFQKNPFM